MRKLQTSRRRGGRLGNESGQALIEFAFVMLMMLALILGLIDFGRLFLQYQVMTGTSREAVRRAVVMGGGTSTAIYDDMIAQLAVGGISTAGAVKVDGACGAPPRPAAVVTVNQCNWDSSTPGDQVRVGISVPFEFWLVGPLLEWATGDRSITLRTAIYMRNE